uniref:Uncharacterized protein n=1 Tax=Arundo donax TaxID=35708 RepID=A0A0A9FD40_ARUDO
MDRSFGIGLVSAAYFSKRFCRERRRALDNAGMSSLLWISTKFTSCASICRKAWTLLWMDTSSSSGLFSCIGSRLIKCLAINSFI